MAGNKNSGRPGGNPNIARGVPKPGPITQKGKMRIIESKLKTGSHSKLIEQYRAKGCNYCPFREKRYKIKVGKTEIDKVERAMCPYYLKDSKTCLAPLDEMVARAKNFSFLNRKSAMQAHDDIIDQAKVALELNQMKEINTKGAPGYYSFQWQELLLNSLEAKEKLRIDNEKLTAPIKTENKNLNVNLNVNEFVDMDDILD